VLARSLVSTAVSQLSRVEDRLLGVLLLVAEERGRMTPDGPTVDAFLTHERLGQLIGAARPTVSLAFTHLRARGLVTVQGRRWVLSREAAHHLADPATS
jgi:CRP-like cAMP-binding protein